MQILTLIYTFFIIILIVYNYLPINCLADDNDLNLHAHGHVIIDKYTGRAIGHGLSTIGSQWGLGAIIVGVSTAVGKIIAKSGVPPVQKVGLIVAAGLISGVGHSWISAANRSAIIAENMTSSTLGKDVGSHINKFINDTSISPLQQFLSDGEIMNYVCLSIVYILIIQLVFKLYF